MKNDLKLKYYIDHIHDSNVMHELRWKEPETDNKVRRLFYIKSLQSKEPLTLCPECGFDIVEDEWGEEYCPKCGTVTRSHSQYSAGFKHDLPYGLKI